MSHPAPRLNINRRALYRGPKPRSTIPSNCLGYHILRTFESGRISRRMICPAYSRTKPTTAVWIEWPMSGPWGSDMLACRVARKVNRDQLSTGSRPSVPVLHLRLHWPQSGETKHPDPRETTSESASNVQTSSFPRLLMPRQSALLISSLGTVSVGASPIIPDSVTKARLKRLLGIWCFLIHSPALPIDQMQTSKLPNISTK
jgi:hypothetical protein